MANESLPKLYDVFKKEKEKYDTALEFIVEHFTTVF